MSDIFARPIASKSSLFSSAQSTRHALHRRHDDSTQRALVAERMASLRVGNPTGANQHTGGISPDGLIPNKSAITLDRAAELAGTSKSQIKRVRHRRLADPVLDGELGGGVERIN